MLFRIFTVVAVIALAISTWILSSPAHRPKLTDAAGKADLPGYYLKNTVLTDYDESGNPSLRIEAGRIDQIGHTPEVTLSNVKVDYIGVSQSWALFGDVGHVEPGGNVVSVTGNVLLRNEPKGRSPAAVVRTDALSYDVAQSIASTKSDVRIEFGPRAITGRGLTANLKERTLRLESRVHGRFSP